MRFLISALSIIALGLGLVGCPGSGGGGGGDSAPAFAVSTTAADFGVVGNAYTSPLAVTGGTPLYTWADVAAALPAGLSLVPATGVISGTPTATTASAFTITFQVTDSAGRTANGPVTLRIRPRTDRASIDTAGSSVAGSSNTAPSISRTNGRFIAFSSTANLVAGVTGNQVYVHDRNTGQPILISKSSLGIAGLGGVSNEASISADGRFIAFASTAANLVPGVSGQQIYLHDTQPSPNGLTTLVSKDGSGSSASAGSSNTSPTISADGRFVGFASNATNLVATVTGQQVYRHDTQPSPNGQNVVVSLDSADQPGTGGNSIAPSITANGSFVALSSTVPLIAPAAASDVYVRAVP